MFLPFTRTSSTVGLEALAAAVVARHEHVGHEHHLDLEIARALARLAAAAGDVEAERARACTAARARAARRRRCAGSRRTPSRTSRDSSAATCRSGSGRCSTTSSIASTPVSASYAPTRSPRCCLARVLAVQLRLERAQQHVVHERALSRSRNAGHRGHGAERDRDVDALEVVLARAGERDPPRPERAGARRAPESRCAPVRYCAGERALGDARHRAGEHELAALLAARRARAPPCSRRRGSRPDRARRRAPCCRASRSRCSSRSRRSMSRECRPIDGSSST